MGHVRIRFRPDKADINKPAVQGVLAVELTASILELANLRRYDGAILAICPPQAPLMGLRIVLDADQVFWIDVPDRQSCQ